MAPDDSSRAAYETHARSSMLAYSLTHTHTHTRKQAETVNPETRRGQYACLLLRGNELRSHTASALRMSLATALAEPLGETDRSRSDSFFLLEWTGRTRVSFCDSSSRDRNRRRSSSRPILLQSVDTYAKIVFERIFTIFPLDSLSFVTSLIIRDYSLFYTRNDQPTSNNLTLAN